jgi:hypothetical protein
MTPSEVVPLGKEAVSRLLCRNNSSMASKSTTTTSSSPEDNYACRIVRSERPCLVCPDRMDLVEAHPRFTLFSGLPLCSSESIDCLDCPNCGFTCSNTDYQYLQICKIQRQGMFQTHSSRRDRKAGSSSSRSRGRRVCSTCHVDLSSKWQFCPGCGGKCGSSSSSSNKKTGFKMPAVVLGSPSDCTSIKEAPASSSTNSPSDTSASSAFGGLSAGTQDSGIVRMVTPPKRHVDTSMDTDMTNVSQVSL